MLQDTIAAILIIAVVWLIVRLAFGGTGSQTGSQNQSIGNTRNGQGTGKESAAVKAWRDARGDREKDLKKKKQEMMEAARRKYLEGGGNSKPNSIAGPSGSSSASSSHVPQSQVLSTT